MCVVLAAELSQEFVKLLYAIALLIIEFTFLKHAVCGGRNVVEFKSEFVDALRYAESS